MAKKNRNKKNVSGNPAKRAEARSWGLRVEGTDIILDGLIEANLPYDQETFESGNGERLWIEVSQLDFRPKPDVAGEQSQRWWIGQGLQLADHIVDHRPSGLVHRLANRARLACRHQLGGALQIDHAAHIPKSS